MPSVGLTEVERNHRRGGVLRKFSMALLSPSNTPVVVAVGVIVQCFLSSCLSLFYSLTFAIVLASCCIMYWPSSTTETSNEESETALSKLVAKLTKENENYRLERDHSLQKISSLESLKQENENLKKQIERQTIKSEELLYKLARLEKEDEVRLVEKRNQEDMIYLEKRKCRERIDEMERVVERYRKDAEQLKFQIEREQDMFRKQYSEAETQLMTEKQQNRQFVIQLQAKQQENQRIHTEAWNEVLKLRAELQVKDNTMEELNNNYLFTLRESEEKHSKAEREIHRNKEEIKLGKENTRKLAEKQREVEELKARLESQASREASIPCCNICEERTKDTCLDPCGHTLCMVCATEITCRNNKCPVCRKHISKKTRLYFT